MKEYASAIVLEINGKKIDDFKSVTEKKRTIRKVVKLMGGIGTANVTPELGATVEYVVPDSKTQFDFDSVKNGTLTITYESGARVIYTGITTLEIGEAKADGENEINRTIDFAATGRRPE
ncbi:MAG: hypothetical protein NTX59_08245 [Elusimicrobia bacterium]|nr:hypothetical protein [Elusimicrobiota bacterium]